MKLLENKVALITGASKGIGRSIAQRFVEEGAKVAFTFLSSVERGKSLEDELSSLGGEAKGFQSDASSSVINTNLKSVFNTTKHAQRSMLKQRSGSIINISSIVGLKGNAGQANYAASKAGIIGFTKSVALELGSRGIRCNAVAPGFIETEMTSILDEKTVQSWRDAIPLKRGGKPEDVANACVYLGSDLSSYVSGQVLQVDGGLLT